MNIWVDDIRDAPPGWVRLCTAESALEYLREHCGEVELISLDHDLGWCETCAANAKGGDVLFQCSHVMSGYNLAVRIALECLWPRRAIYVHSMNPVGAARIVNELKPKAPTDVIVRRVLV